MMRAKNHIYIGLIFPASIILDEETCQVQIKRLVLIPPITLTKAKYIKYNSDLWAKVKIFSHYLHFKLFDISFFDSESRIRSIEKRFVSFLLRVFYELLTMLALMLLIYGGVNESSDLSIMQFLLTLVMVVLGMYIFPP